MIQREARIRIWYLIKRVIKKLGMVDIPKSTEEEYWELMKQPLETTRYLLIEHYNLDGDFFYHAFEEKDLIGKTEQEKIKEMYESSSKEEENWESLLLIDVKTMKAYILSKEIKYTKKEIK